MLRMNTELAQRSIIEAEIRIPAFGRLKDGKRIDLYFLTVGGSNFTIAEIEWEDEEEESFYMLGEDDLGTSVFIYEQWEKLMQEGKKILSQVVKILENDK